MESAISFKGVSKRFGKHTIISGLDLEIPSGKIVVLIGPSGCGKTTTLRMINRLIEPSAGNITVNGEDANKMDPVELRRGIGYVIQQVGLIPHMTVGDNIALVERLKKGKKAVDGSRVIELLEMVGLSSTQYQDRYPKELSGGQQQRVGVARALMADPPIILMDEPFSALDPITREQLQDELIRLNESLNKTIIFVTHDMDEALKIADQIVIMQGGKVIQQGSPEQILRNPANGFVREFIGERHSKAHLPLVAQDVMVKARTSKPHRGLAESIEYMHRRQVTSLLITDSDDRLIGIVSANEIMHHFAEETLTLKDIMQTEFECVQLDTPVIETIPLMQNGANGLLPVVTSDGKLAGVLTRSSMVDVLAKPYLEEGYQHD